MLAVATYILREVKSNIDGCGLLSNVWLLRPDGTRELFEQDDLNELESYMQRFDQIIRVVFDAAFDVTVHRSLPDNLAAEVKLINEDYKEWMETLRERRIDDMKRRMERKDWLQARSG